MTITTQRVHNAYKVTAKQGDLTVTSVSKVREVAFKTAIHSCYKIIAICR